MISARQLTERHRARQLLLAKSTKDSVKSLWPLLDWTQLDATYPDLATQMLTLVKRNRQTSNGLASAYLKSFSVASGIKGRPAIVFADPMPADQFTASLRTTSIAALKESSKQGVEPALALLNSLTQTQGSMSRLVLGAGRETVARTTVADKNFQGWVRVGNGECEWCQQYLDGEVHMIEWDFPAHDHCACSSEPSAA